MSEVSGQRRHLDVYMFEFRVSKIMLERARSNEKIKWRTNAVVTEVVGDNAVTGLTLRDTVVVPSPNFRSPACSSPAATIRAVNCSAINRPSITRSTSLLSSRPRRPNPRAFAAGDLVDKTYRWPLRRPVAVAPR